VVSTTLSNPSDQAITYTFVLTNGTAGSAGLHTTCVDVLVPAGATTGTVSVPTTADTIDEVTETLYCLWNCFRLRVPLSTITMPHYCGNDHPASATEEDLMYSTLH
jgi:hypothetical protein